MSVRTSTEVRLLELLKRLGDLHLRAGPLQDFGVTLPQMALLGLVSRSPGCRLQDIADKLGLTAPTVSVGVRRLVEAGWLERTPDPEDKRAARIYLTEEGEALKARVQRHRVREVRHFLAGLSQGEQEQLLDLLGKAIHAAEQREEQ